MYRRFFVVFFSLLACCLSFPRAAYAAYNPTVVWSGYYDDGDSFGSVVKAGGTFDAAAVSLGYDPARISANDKSKLADPDYGGRFYLYSQTFARVNTPLDFPDWVPGYIVMGSTISSAWDSLTNQFVRLWVSGVSVSLRDGALADLMAVLAGEDLGGGDGGGGGSSVVDGYVAIPLDVNPSDSLPYGPWLLNTNDGHSYTSYKSAPSSVYILIPSSSYSSLSGYFSSSNYCFAAMESNTRGYNGVHFIFSNNTNAMTYADGAGTILLGCRLGGSIVTYRANNRVVDSSGRLLVYTSFYSSGSVGGFSNFNPCVTYWKRFDGAFEAPVAPPEPPDGDWPEPETPVAPTAPELPDPVTPTVTPEPTVTEPTPTWPVIPTPTAPTVTLTDTPDGLDYTQLLTLINDNLNDINSYTVAINSNFNSLRSDLVIEFDSVVQALRNIYQYLQHLDNLLERHCVHLQNKMEDVSVDIQNKMRELVHWLADEIDFDSSENGDDELSDILSTINGKLGGGTYEPNPISNEDGYYEWLDDLWDRFLLGDDWESSVSGISSSFGQLKTRFPFSVPWDIVALFRLFVHDPVTPEFDLPLYFSSDSSTPVHVDLSAWDDVASIVRPLVYVIFALKLALLSRDLLGGLGADKGGL